ncbi:MAG: helix-turn-helix transcriptional regulator [Tenericutes bacterium]|nr:helix-turn-helix transcriptional regulator [Mycoplasmatota bacterium]
MLFNLHYIGFQALEKAPFEITRPEGSARYIFFHFTSSVKVEINGEIIDAAPGSCIIYEPRHPQRFFVNNINLNHDYLDFSCYDTHFFEDIRLPLNTIISPSLSKFIISSIEKIHQETNTNRLGSEYIIQSLMETLFVSISRKTHNFSFNSADYEKTLQRKFEQIRLDMYHRPSEFKVKTMANKLDFSISHFSFLYKKFFFIKPIDDLTKARIEHIKNQNINLISTYELANSLGFDSTEYFYRWFKQNFGVTPKEYKKRN